MDMPNLSVLAGVGVAAALTAVASFWSQARSFFQYLSSFLLLQKHVQGGIITAVQLHIRKNYRRAPSGISHYRSLIMQVDDQSMNSIVPFDMPNSTGIWFGARGLFLLTAGDNLILVGPRWFFKPDLLIVDAITEYNEQCLANTRIGSGSFWIKKIIGTAGEMVQGNQLSKGRHTQDTPSQDSPAPTNTPGSWYIPDVQVDRSFMYAPERYVQNKKGAGPFRGLFFDQPVLDLVASLTQWFTREEWYRERGIPWRTGVLLHGPGGTGKSSLAKALAQHLGVPLCQFYLNTLTDREFLDEWGDLHTPCVVALEDFDTVFHGRESVTVHKSLSFECVLNQISGISSVNGILLVVTTNHMEHIDPALGQLDANGRPTRPGRIDHIVHLGNATETQRRDIARYTLNGWAEDLVDELVLRGANTTAAQFQFMCIEAAMARLNSKVSSETPP